MTFVEFAREKETLFGRWCKASNVSDFASLSELVLLEEFKNSLPDRLVTYVNEQKVASLAQAAVLADEYVLTHKHTFVVPARSEGRVFMPSARDGRDSRDRKESPTPFPRNVGLKPRECFYCHQPGHMIADCNMYKRKYVLLKRRSWPSLRFQFRPPDGSCGGFWGWQVTTGGSAETSPQLSPL